MPDLMTASIKDKLWHAMREDLAHYAPWIMESQELMCCACGRFLKQDDFTLEHLIPQQALKRDPAAVKINPDTPANIRAGNLLLCKAPIKYKGNQLRSLGCNSWKGTYYDKAIGEMLSEKAWRPQAATQVHITAGLCLSYLALVAEFGYRVVLMPSGLLMREQFFNPRRFHPALPIMSQMLLGGSVAGVPHDAPMWAKPFSFGFQEGTCSVATRNFVISVPVSRDPRLPIARHLKVAPAKYKLRPDFSTVFT